MGTFQDFSIADNVLFSFLQVFLQLQLFQQKHTHAKVTKAQQASCSSWKAEASCAALFSAGHNTTHGAGGSEIRALECGTGGNCNW